jgi:hypothetical protein
MEKMTLTEYLKTQTPHTVAMAQAIEAAKIVREVVQADEPVPFEAEYATIARCLCIIAVSEGLCVAKAYAGGKVPVAFMDELKEIGQTIGVDVDQFKPADPSLLEKVEPEKKFPLLETAAAEPPSAPEPSPAAVEQVKPIDKGTTTVLSDGAGTPVMQAIKPIDKRTKEYRAMKKASEAPAPEKGAQA